jgi:hypothetical protein
MDQLTSKSDIDNISLEAIAAFVQVELIAKPGLVGTVTDLSSLVGPGMDSLKIPRFDSFTAQSKVAATKLSAQKLTSSPDTLLLNKQEAVYTMIEDIAQLQSSVNMQQLYGERIASALMKKWDAAIYAELILGGSTSYSSGSALTKADFTKARKIMKDLEIELDSGSSWLAINPAAEKVVMDLSDFVDADKWSSGSEQIKVNGFIGRAYGFNIVVGTQYTSPVFYQSSAVAFARQEQMKMASNFSIADLATELAGWHLYGVKQLQNGAASVKFA